MSFRILRLPALVGLLAFVGLTLYDVTVHGYFEEPTLFPDHGEAGAGSISLIVRSLLALASVLGLPFLLWSRGHFARSLLATFAAVTVLIAIFFWSCVGLEREGPGFSESAFREVAERPGLTRDQVISRLGLPLAKGSDADGEYWSYTYMPSGGFGWRKRLLVFNHHGVLERTQSFREP